MKVLPSKRILDFAKHNPKCEVPLHSWKTLLNFSNPRNYSDLKKLFNSVDSFDGWYVFNIKGNQFRVVCKIDFKAQVCVVRHIMSHTEYDRGKWK